MKVSVFKLVCAFHESVLQKLITNVTIADSTGSSASSSSLEVINIPRPDPAIVKLFASTQTTPPYNMHTATYATLASYIIAPVFPLFR